MKIIVSSNTAWSIYNFRLELIHSLKEKGYHIVVVAPKDTYSSCLEKIGCEMIDISIDNKGINLFIDFMTFLKYRSIFSKIRPNVILNFTPKPVIYGTLAARLVGTPVVNTLTGLGTAFIRKTLLTIIVEVLFRLSLRYASKVFVQNSADESIVLRKNLAPKEIVEQVPGSGVNVDKFVPAAYENNMPITFLMISRLLRDKGVVEFIDAARHVRAIQDGVRFQLLGSIDVKNRTVVSQNELDSWVSEGVIEYMGEVQDVRPFIEKSHCVVLPSYREGLSRSLLEAAAMARPVITTDVPGCREVVIPHESGFLCKAADSKDLADKIFDFLALSHKQKKTMGERGRQLVLEQFNQCNVISAYTSAIQHATTF